MAEATRFNRDARRCVRRLAVVVVLFDVRIVGDVGRARAQLRGELHRDKLKAAILQSLREAFNAGVAAGIDVGEEAKLSREGS